MAMKTPRCAGKHGTEEDNANYEGAVQFSFFVRNCRGGGMDMYVYLYVYVYAEVTCHVAL